MTPIDNYDFLFSLGDIKVLLRLWLWPRLCHEWKPAENKDLVGLQSGASLAQFPSFMRLEGLRSSTYVGIHFIMIHSLQIYFINFRLTCVELNKCLKVLISLFADN